jgi:outer membrane beta-barrel protein
LGLCAVLALSGQVAWAQDKEATPPGGEEAAPPAEAPAEAPAAEPPKEGEASTPVEEVKPGATKNFSDIYVVPRRPVLKRKRVELIPTYNVTLNNEAIRHHGFGLMLYIYLSEALFIGLEGTYYVKELLDRYFLLGADQRVIPSVNRYVWSAFLDFGYVPIHGKFTFFNTTIAHWECFVNAGVGVLQTDVIPRNPANDSFTNYLIAGNVGIGSRMWLARWFAIDAYLKAYMFADQLENTNRMAGEDAATAKMNATSQFTFDVTFGVGVSIFLPPGFEYHTLR